MRSERLLSLLLDLADGKIHSSASLARKYGVSVRSVYRDMELLSVMGFPLEAEPGREGGYRVLPGFALDRSILDEGELEAVAAALGGIERATGSSEAEVARAKLGALIARAPGRRRSWIRIELGEGRRDRERIETLRRAIDERRLVRLRYRDASGKATKRKVEPCAVVYLWQSWYLWAYCRLRGAFRLFKLARVESAQGLLERFEPRPEPSENAWREAWESGPEVEVLLEIGPEAASRSDEWFGPQEATPSGGRLVRASFPENDWLLGFLLSFGEGLRVLEPESLATSLAERARRIWLANNLRSTKKY